MLIKWAVSTMRTNSLHSEGSLLYDIGHILSFGRVYPRQGDPLGCVGLFKHKTHMLEG